MKFDHLVKHNGIYYPAGADVPTEETKKSEGVKAPAPLVSGKVDDDAAIEAAKIITDDEIQANPDMVRAEFDKKTRKYSEEELNVPYFSLKAMAKKEGITIPEKAKAGDIRDMLRAL